MQTSSEPVTSLMGVPFYTCRWRSVFNSDLLYLIFIQLSATFCNNDEALQWASTVVSTDTIVTSLEDSQSPFDIVNAVVTREIKETLINFTDSGNRHFC